MISNHEFIFQNISIPYWQNGDNPRLLIVSGAHGDEHEVVPILSEEIKKRLKELPQFLFIPKLSPSAMLRKTRENDDGLDIERSFHKGSTHAEAQALMEFLKEKQFDICLSFHEDWEWEGFYMYNISDKSNTPESRTLCASLQAQNVMLHTGIDDKDDSLLGNYVEEGYVHIPINEQLKTKPFFSAWLIKQGITSKVLVLEVPKKSSPKGKECIVSSCFDCLL